jgi:hypothetical protein
MLNKCVMAGSSDIGEHEPIFLQLIAFTKRKILSTTQKALDFVGG